MITSLFSLLSQGTRRLLPVFFSLGSLGPPLPQVALLLAPVPGVSLGAAVVTVVVVVPLRRVVVVILVRVFLVRLKR